MAARPGREQADECGVCLRLHRRSEERAGAASGARRARQTPLLLSQRKQGSTCGVSARKAIRPKLLGQGQCEGHPGLAVTRRMITALKAEGSVPETSPPTIIAEAEAINPLASCVCTLGQRALLQLPDPASFPPPPE